MFENFCPDIIETMKCFALESFNLSCQAEHTKINSRLNFNPGLALITFWTTRPTRWRVLPAATQCPHKNDLFNSKADINISKLKQLKGFRISHLNITSLLKHLDQLRIYLHDKPLDVLSINETRLDSSIYDKDVQINGYDIVS